MKAAFFSLIISDRYFVVLDFRLKVFIAEIGFYFVDILLDFLFFR